MDRARIGPSRWRGQPGRLEVWYATLTDRRTGTGFWIHAEVRANVDGTTEAHGWATVFPTSGPPVTGRFGPARIDRADSVAHPAWFDAAGVRLGPSSTHGSAGPIAWDLHWLGASGPLHTFPRWAWERELLPGAQVVAAPSAAFVGDVRCGDATWHLEDAVGAVSRIYGHGSAERWAWLHADLGDGDVLEVVAAASRRSVFRPLGVLPFVQLRLDGRDWPRSPLTVALKGRADVGLPTFAVDVGEGDRRLSLDVDVPASQSVALRYVDPDGSTATCTNSERATARILLERRGPDGWLEERRWTLDGTAHAEVGTRP